MSQENLGFTGAVPPNVSIQANVARALEFQGTHTPTETEHWFMDVFRTIEGGEFN
jgi:hypothetical protein